MSTISSIFPASAALQSSGDGSSSAGPSPNSTDFSTTLDQAKSRPTSDAMPQADTSLKPVKQKKTSSKSGKADTATKSASSTKDPVGTKNKPSDSTDSSKDPNADSTGQNEQNGQQQNLKAQSGNGKADQAANAPGGSSQTQNTDSNNLPGTAPIVSSSADSAGATASTPTKTKSTAAPAQQGVDPTALPSIIAGAATKLNSAATGDAAQSADSGSGKVSGKPNVSPFKPGDAAATDADGDPSTATDSGAGAAANSSLGGTAKGTDKGAAPTDSAGDASFAALLPGTAAHSSTATAVAAAPLPAAQSQEVQFAQANNPSIVSSIHGQLLPDGGTMSIRLDPPELGAMQITVKIESGVISASFETSSDQATRLLSHTLGDLKSALESQGVSVDSLHVHQSSKSDNPSNQQGDSNSDRQGLSDQRTADQEQQRREMLRRMWKKVNGTEDPLDLVA